jgi:hypothetical protein
VEEREERSYGDKLKIYHTSKIFMHQGERRSKVKRGEEG